MRLLRTLSLGALYALLLWPPLALGGHRGWPLAVTQLFALAGLLLWVLVMLAGQRLEWRRTALDLPLALFTIVILAQLALGNHSLTAWALGPPPADVGLTADFPARLFLIGTVAPPRTAQALLLFLTYVSAYVLVVNLARTRRELDRLVRVLLLAGSLLAFLALLDFLTGEAWLIRWREEAIRGRLAGTFVNPDHFASWLAMLVCLGSGYLLGRSRLTRSSGSAPGSLTSHEGREQLVRRYLPFIGVGVMTLALVFTLSRGGILSLLAAFGAMLALEGMLGRMRWSLVLVGALLTVTLGYGAWIGLDPLLERVWHGDVSNRWIQALTTLPMLGSFPLMGVGLGAYREIYPRYQPLALGPGRLYYTDAHNDLLQLGVETGALGAVLFLFAVWRVGRDLVGAHLLGRGRCPVGGGEDEGAQRNEPFSVGVAVGAMAAVLVLVIHSAFDFAARIPANGILGAACLGLATVALHTRFSASGDRLLTSLRTSRVGDGRVVPTLLAGAAVALSLLVAPVIVRRALIDAKLLGATGAGALNRVEGALALDPGDVRALKARAELRLAAAHHVWNSGQAPDGALLASWQERRREALDLLTGAVRDLRKALASTPSDPSLHEALAWVHATAAALDSTAAEQHRALAFASIRRAIAVQPENPLLYRSLAILTATRREPRIPTALEAARAAVKRDPALLSEVADLFVPLRLGAAQWLAIVPDSALDQLELGARLEERALRAEAAQVYRRAAELAPPDQQPLARWMLGRLLLRQEDYRGAALEIQLALARDSDNPELHLARAQALTGLEDPGALAAYRAALLASEAWERRSPGERPFRLSGPQARSLLSRTLGQAEPPRPVKYRRALAQYLVDRKLWEPAAREWERVLVEAPDDAGAQFGIGLALSGLGREAEALEAYRKAVALDRRAVPFRLRFAQGLWNTEQYYQAINEWRTVIAQEPGNIEARLALAKAYLKIGERIEAFREYQRILLMVPDQLEARRGLARLGEGR